MSSNTDASPNEIGCKDKDKEAPVSQVMNPQTLFCTKCSSKVLLENMGLYVTTNFELPKMTQVKNFVVAETELITECYLVQSPFDFENAGFSHTTQNIKYLTCADCELGPIGWQDITVPNSPIYVAISRLSSESSDPIP